MLLLAQGCITFFAYAQKTIFVNPTITFMKGICKLYQSQCDLRNSHVYPSFVVDYLKNTGSKYLRNATTPNLRQQDGIKRFWLSHEAEEDFSRREKWFAENVFLKYLVDKQNKFEYDENLYYFSLSFLSRILLLEIDHPSIKRLSFFPLLLDVAEEWRLFLKDKTLPLKYKNINILFTHDIVHHSAGLTGVDYYFTRMLDGCVIANRDCTYIAIYGKFLKFMFWCVIRNDKSIDDKYLRINPDKGVINTQQTFHDSEMASFFINRMQSLEALAKPSEKQQEKIMQEMLKDKNGFYNSDAGRAIINDIYLSDKTKNK